MMAMGFGTAGVWRHAGYKLGQWWDVGVWQKTLQPPRQPPAAVVPFPQLTGTSLQSLLDGLTSRPVA